MASDLSKLDLLVIWLDGLHIGNDLVLVAAPGIDDGDDHKHPLEARAHALNLTGLSAGRISAEHCT
jgi:hypothetical protein